MHGRGLDGMATANNVASYQRLILFVVGLPCHRLAPSRHIRCQVIEGQQNSRKLAIASYCESS